MELELMKWGDGTTRLAYWDSIHGADRIFVLSEDGTATEDCDGDTERHSVDLVAELRRMVEEC